MNPKRRKLVVNNKMRPLGRTEVDDGKGKVDKKKLHIIEINVKAHKGDKAELASTIKHEQTHAKNPKMTEKEVYKRTAKTKIPPEEQSKLLSQLRHKRLNYKVGALKRKYKMGKGAYQPGDFISKSRT